MRPGVAQADDRGAGCDEVGPAGCVAAARPRGNDVVVSGDGAPPVRASHSDDVRVVRRVVHADVAVALVARSRDDDDAAAPRLLDGVCQRVESVVLNAVGAKRQVQHADVQAVAAAVLHHPVDPGDDLRDIGGTGGVRDLDVEDAGVRGDADEAVVRRRPDRCREVVVPAGDDPGHVRAVAVGVEVAQLLVARLEGQVRPVDDLAGGREAVHRDDTGVQHGDVHAGAGQAAAPDLLRPDGLGDVEQRRGPDRRVGVGRVRQRHGPVRRDPGDRGVACQPVYLRRGQHRHLGIDEGQLPGDPATGGNHDACCGGFAARMGGEQDRVVGFARCGVRGRRSGELCAGGYHGEGHRGSKGPATPPYDW